MSVLLGLQIIDAKAQQLSGNKINTGGEQSHTYALQAGLKSQMSTWGTAAKSTKLLKNNKSCSMRLKSDIQTFVGLHPNFLTPPGLTVWLIQQLFAVMPSILQVILYHWPTFGISCVLLRFMAVSAAFPLSSVVNQTGMCTCLCYGKGREHYVHGEWWWGGCGKKPKDTCMVVRCDLVKALFVRSFVVRTDFITV